MGHYGVGRDRRCPLASLAGARIVTATMLILPLKCGTSFSYHIPPRDSRSSCSLCFRSYFVTFLLCVNEISGNRAFSLYFSREKILLRSSKIEKTLRAVSCMIFRHTDVDNFTFEKRIKII